MIRTLVEIRHGRVSIQETDSGTTVTVALDDAPSTVPLAGLGERLYTAEEVGDFQASEAELVAAPLREAIQVLERKVVEYDRDRTSERDRADQNKARASRTEARLKEADAELARFRKHHVCTDACKPNEHVAFTGKTMLRELEELLHDERERADKAEAALAALRELKTQRDEAVQDLNQALEKARQRSRAARELLTTEDVVQARRMDGSRTGTTMGYAIEAALRALGGPPSPPTDETSQA